MHCAAFAFSTLSPSPITTAGEAAASSRLLHGRGKGHRHSIQCCPQGCGGSCNGGGGSSVSAYAFISSQADLSIAKSVIDETGLKTLLEGPFANTLFVPNNAAMDAYAAPITANATWDSDIGRGFLQLFFTKVLTYHAVTGSYSLSNMPAGEYGTLYVSNNGMPHKVTRSSGNSLVDEQGGSSSINGPSSAVLGGGYVHTITAVLEANDIFPSLGEALASAEFSQLRAVIAKIENTDPNPPLTELLSGISGTIALPNNQAFEGVNIADVSASTLLDIVTYHICPFKRMYRLLYTPFIVGKKPGRNPCLPAFSRAYGFPYGLKWAFGSPSNMSITFASGVFPDGLVAKDAPIVFADISIPTQSAHRSSKLHCELQCSNPNGLRLARAPAAKMHNNLLLWVKASWDNSNESCRMSKHCT
ncbi:hypothetical protein OEZ86_013927 [Tetradesmus obliquus]|nr:hypothetical protein OEZ86_013927 [Tetradesmus obliquus]